MTWRQTLPRYDVGECEDCPWPQQCGDDNTCWRRVTRDDERRQQTKQREAEAARTRRRRPAA